MSKTQQEKATAFAALHARDEAFVIANAFDGCSARMFEALGYEAIATSSWVQAAMLGRFDGNTSRTEAMAHAKVIVEASDLPVSADLENGFGEAPDDAANTITQAGAIGLVGGSIEAASDDASNPIYGFDLAVKRVEAAVAAARALPFKFTLTARTENFVRGITDLEDTLRRLQAFEAAGADVLMAPGLPDLESVRHVCKNVGKPVNFMAGIPGQSFTQSALQNAGVTRISVATSLYTTAMAAAWEAAIEIRDHGTFTYIDRPGVIDFATLLRST